MTTLILIPKPVARQQIYNPQELLRMQNVVYDTMILALARLEPRQHHEFLSKSLTILTDQPDLDSFSTISLAELLFVLIDSRTESRSLLNLQNVLIHASQALKEGAC